MSKTKRAEQAERLEAWADNVEPAELELADTSSLRTIAALSDEADAVERALREAVGRARAHGRTWSEIGSMLGVSKQAAQRKYTSSDA